MIVLQLRSLTGDGPLGIGGLHGHRSSLLLLVPVEIFAKVPYLQHYYDTGCMEEGISVLERVGEVRS